MKKITLIIDTSDREEIKLFLEKDSQFLSSKKIKAIRSQSEKLLVSIDQFLLKNKIKLSDLKEIKVASCGHSFTSLRIGVVTANALGYALKIPVLSLEDKNKSSKKKMKKLSYSIVEPVYDKEANIGVSKKPVY